jgi:hypothetical protein
MSAVNYRCDPRKWSLVEGAYSCHLDGTAVVCDKNMLAVSLVNTPVSYNCFYLTSKYST